MGSGTVSAMESGQREEAIAAEVVGGMGGKMSTVPAPVRMNEGLKA